MTAGDRRTMQPTHTSPPSLKRFANMEVCPIACVISIVPSRSQAAHVQPGKSSE